MTLSNSKSIGSLIARTNQICPPVRELFGIIAAAAAGRKSAMLARGTDNTSSRYVCVGLHALYGRLAHLEASVRTDPSATTQISSDRHRRNVRVSTKTALHLSTASHPSEQGESSQVQTALT